MKSYEDFKKWCEENKNKFILAVCFVLVFFVGFGTGRYNKEIQNSKSKTQSNYNKNSNTNPDKPKQPVGESKTPAVLPASTTTPSCVIKGNISTKGEKIYHILGGAFYNLVKPEQCFTTEQDAVNAGYRKSTR